MPLTTVTRSCLPLVVALFVAGCATGQKDHSDSQLQSARQSLSNARSPLNSFKERAADYVEAAELTAPPALSRDPRASKRSGSQELQYRAIYNASTAELTQLLRSAGNGKSWNHPLTLSTGQGRCHLCIQAGAAKAFWAPNYFTSFIPADRVSERHVRKPNHQEGIGGALVGVRAPAKKEPFAPKLGIATAVTSTLEFNVSQVRLVLRNPIEQPSAKFRGDSIPLHADFSASLALHSPVNELLDGFKAMIRVEKYMPVAGLYFIEPFDPDKIPLIFVHGLMSTGHMWLNVANEIDADPELRRRYQVWVFAYPTGNPLAYSALRLREELAKVQRIYAPKHGYVMIGHSMGGLLSRMQATSSGQILWDASLKGSADRLYAKLPADNLLKRMFIFNANPKVERIIFICVPHRGSEMALGSIGALARKLICLPKTLTEAIHTIASSLGDGVFLVLGQQPLPTSIDGLSPSSTTLIAMDNLPVRAPFHSIIGDRGKGNTPKSSDGVVPYWSSHLDQAQSELIVPGPHGSYELPQTIAELKRILRFHLRQADKRQRG